MVSKFKTGCPRDTQTPLWQFGKHESTASALDSASGVVLSSEALSPYAKARAIAETTASAKLAWAEAEAEAMVL